ncbi:hypothetical protein GUITHDRAFT_112170 [Guillardia theta CCMP2712]|uniref:Uncharacterized protein n=1 Tax=Guillardia theta (strain CCMP2712) TaxID=905079 RepID=L1J0Y6_GUITC|nr:hypothetical protein GUITHDRAFT_112170 [Guillardia theta CCMP2712]EKX41755.1 hypothetical protein GUITHDRAFT_112170 [Guillardia theta CCMP2712]|eukprot:XP_005828735.1 hypothetical protein GUITHDRAFT_112170 [Guillardia theta CCMP2712]
MVAEGRKEVIAETMAALVDVGCASHDNGRENEPVEVYKLKKKIAEMQRHHEQSLKEAHALLLEYERENVGSATAALPAATSDHNKVYALTSPSNTRDPEFIKKNWIGLEDILRDSGDASQDGGSGASSLVERKKVGREEMFQRGRSSTSSSSNLQGPFEIVPAAEEELVAERDRSARLQRDLASCQSFLRDLVASLDTFREEGAEMSRRIVEAEDARRETVSSVRMQNSRLLGALRDAMSEKEELEKQVKGRKGQGEGPEPDVPVLVLSAKCEESARGKEEDQRKIEGLQAECRRLSQAVEAMKNVEVSGEKEMGELQRRVAISQSDLVQERKARLKLQDEIEKLKEAGEKNEAEGQRLERIISDNEQAIEKKLLKGQEILKEEGRQKEAEIDWLKSEERRRAEEIERLSRELSVERTKSEEVQAQLKHSSDLVKELRQVVLLKDDEINQIELQSAMKDRKLELYGNSIRELEDVKFELVKQLKAERKTLVEAGERAEREKVDAEERMIAYKEEVQLLQAASREQERAREQASMRDSTASMTAFPPRKDATTQSSQENFPNFLAGLETSQSTRTLQGTSNTKKLEDFELSWKLYSDSVHLRVLDLDRTSSSIEKCLAILDAALASDRNSVSRESEQQELMAVKEVPNTAACLTPCHLPC